MEIINIKVGDIKPYNKNTKDHTEFQVKKVAESIEKFGWTQPLVLDSKNNLIIGHCRLLAAKLLNLKEVPAVIKDNLTEDEVKALRIADNKLNEALWKFDLLEGELKELKDNSFDIDITGFDDSFLNREYNFKNTEIDVGNLNEEVKDKVSKKCPSCGYEF